MEKLGKKDEVVILLGSTGAGKSSLGNSLSGDPKLFISSPGAESFTVEACVQRTNWNQAIFEESAEPRPLTLCDTPGMFDSRQRDYENMAAMVEYFEANVKEVKAFLIVLNGQQHRLDANLREMIDLFDKVFIRMWENTMIVMTRWPSDQRSEEIRQKTGETREKKTAELQTYLKQQFKSYPAKGVPVAFIDNYPDVSSAEELTSFQVTVREVMEFVAKRKQTYNIKKMKKEAIEIMNLYNNSESEELQKAIMQRSQLEKTIETLKSNLAIQEKELDEAKNFSNEAREQSQESARQKRQVIEAKSKEIEQLNQKLEESDKRVQEITKAKEEAAQEGPEYQVQDFSTETQAYIFGTLLPKLGVIYAQAKRTNQSCSVL